MPASISFWLTLFAIGIAASLCFIIGVLMFDKSMRVDDEQHAPEAEADHRREAWIKFRDNNSEN